MNTTVPNQTVLPPGPKPLPYIGNVLEFRRDQLGYLEWLQRTYGDMATVYLGTTPVVMLFKPEHVRYVLTENPRNFTSREIAFGLLDLIGDGLLTIDGEAHREQRRLVQPAFHKKRVESYADIMSQYTQELLKGWHAGDCFDMARAMQELTLRIVAMCLFHVDLASQVAELGQAFTSMIGNPIGLLEGFLNLRIDQPFTAYGKRMAAKRQVDAFIYEQIALRRAEGRDVGDVLSMVLEAQDDEHGLTNTQVRDHIMTFFAAGHETTANALTFTFYLLSKNPNVLEKLLTELETVLAGRTPTIDDVSHLPYTEWVLNESMRLYPPAWTIGRHATEAFDLDGVHFPAGTMVMFSQWVQHRLPAIWGDPTAFRPERWDPENGQKVPPWSYFPFGGGPRICIGMPFAQLEAKLLLAMILQKFVPSVSANYGMELSALITLRPKHGLPVKLLPTSSTNSSSDWERLLSTTSPSQVAHAERKGCLGAIANMLGFLSL